LIALQGAKNENEIVSKLRNDIKIKEEENKKLAEILKQVPLFIFFIYDK
jgi:hypothetical protein